MRIISGIAKGRRLTTPPLRDFSIRPTADRAREALFNIISNRIPGSSVLDLFAGTGALGLEALSRGADNVVLVDNGRTALKIMQQNSSFFHKRDTDSPVTIIKDDLRRPSFLHKLPDTIPSKFDLIFADPPYDKGFSQLIITFIDKNQLLESAGLLVVEERQNVDLPKQLPHLTLCDRRKYGEACFSFYQPSRPSEDGFSRIDTSVLKNL